MRLNYIDNCDCLEGLAEIPDKSVDLVLTDPPYSINLKSSGVKGSKLNPWADLCNSSHAFLAWMKQAQRILKDDGALWTFINWRGLPAIIKAGCDCGWQAESCLIWDKGLIGPAGIKQLRPSYEMVVLFAKPDFKIENRSLADIQKFQWRSTKPTGHPAEKPVDLMRWLISISGKTNGVICDPFMGSGTVGCAAVLEGNNYIGFEMDPNWADFGQKRIAEAVDALLMEDIPQF